MMPRMILTFLFVWALIALGTTTFWNLSGYGKLKVLKVIALSGLFAAVAFLLLGVVVYLF
jgi:hypothetical protein